MCPYIRILTIYINITTQMQKQQISEETTTSKKWTELATQRQADQASKLNYLVKKEARLLKTLENTRAKIASFNILDDLIVQEAEAIVEEPPMSLRDEKRLERQKKKEERRTFKEKKLKEMSPEHFQKYQEKQEKLLERRQFLKYLSTEEKYKWKADKKADRLQYKLNKQQRKEDKIAQMSPERIQKYQEKQAKIQAKKNEFLNMTYEERQQFKANKKAETAKRKEGYNYLKQNWSDNIPSNLGHLIIDGNNMRGGGPRRHSRDVILNHVNETIQLSKDLTDSTKTVWFDHKPGKYKSINDIEVKFSHDEIADDLIVQEAEAIVEDRTVLVVTSDRGLALRVLDLGGYVMRNGKFNEINPNAPKNRH